jgi:hypothetical protein
MKVFKVGDTAYAINMNKFIEWVSSNSEEDNKSVQSSVTEVWSQTDEEDNSLSLMSKELTDVRGDNSSITSVKYDVVKDILNVILDIDYGPDGASAKNERDLTFSESLCFNTLLIQGIIYEIGEGND